MRRFRTILVITKRLSVILVIGILCIFYIFHSYIPSVSNLLTDIHNHSSLFQRQTHLFDNSCKFAWTEPLDSSLNVIWIDILENVLCLQKQLKFPKRDSCEKYNIDLFKRYPATGEFSMKLKAYAHKLECIAQVLDGGFRPNAQAYQLGKTQAFSPKLNNKFWINANNFIITCFSGQSVIFRKQFMGFKMDENLKLVVDGSFPIPDADARFYKYNSEIFSISILGLDSTSRAQFARHLRKTSQFLNQLGSVVFDAYNKVGDNSAINILPILADPLDETENFSFLDDTGDVNINKILPAKTPLNPDKLKWVWKQLHPEYITMYNDDIMHMSRGLFHYPSNNFLAGFSELPATFYYRPYYNHLYNQLGNWWRKCLDGQLLAEVFLDSWFRFERVFAKIPHFGFTFMASLTHDDPSNLEHLDQALYQKLEYLNRTGCLENTIFIIFGDHGNRVHPINRYTFAGKIEERAPYLSVLVPPRFRTLFPEKYEALKQNSQRFVSNFHLHSTLKFIINLSNNVKSSNNEKSLFELQPSSSTCQDNRVISNHCLCMVDASKDISKLPDSKTLKDAFKKYMNNFRNCFDLDALRCGNVTDTLMPNNYVQVWARTKISESEIKRKKKKTSPIIYLFLTCEMKSTNGIPVEFLSQFRLVQDSQNVTIPYPPRLKADPSTQCSQFSFPSDYCRCLNL